MMSKTKPRKVRQNRKVSRNKQSPPVSQGRNGELKPKIGKSFFYYFRRTFQFLLVIAGLMALYPIIHPDILITPSSNTKDRNPFKHKWIVTNSGWGPVSDLNIELRPHQIIATGAKVIGPNDFSAKITFDAGKIGKLSAGESTSFEVPIILSPNSRMENADIAFSLRYKAKFFPFVQWTKTQRFIPSPQKDGTWDWYPYNIPK